MPPTTAPTNATEWARLRAVLPGTWRILATTFPLWRSRKRLPQTITYRLVPGEDLRLRDEVGYLTRSGRRRRMHGIDDYDPRTGRLIRHARGPLWPVRSRSQWSVEHISHDGELMAIMFDRSAFTPAGMDVLGRGTEARPGLGARLAPVDIGLSGMEFTDLVWLPA